MVEQPVRKRILRRRQSLTAAFEAVLHGISTVLLAYGLSVYFDGSFRLVDLYAVISVLAAMTVIYDHLGVYRRHSTFPEKSLTISKAWLLALAFVLFAAFFVGDVGEYYPPEFVALFAAGGLVVQLSIHWLLAVTPFFRPEKNRLAVIVGGGWLAKHTYERVNANRWIPERVCGIISVTEDDKLEAVSAGLPVIGALEDIESILDDRSIKVVYVVTSLDASVVLGRLYLTLLDRSIDINWIPDIFQLSLVNPNVKEISGVPIVTLSESPLAGEWSHLLKTAEDKLLSAILIILSCPLLIAAAAAIKLDSPGPVIFTQRRTGWDGKVFAIWKFRSMYVHEPEEGYVKQATAHDPRITRVGRFLRRSSIDELPQLFNVFRGDMSLVGPRPHAVEHDDLYSKKIRNYLARHRIKPGITGLAQVMGFRGETRELKLMQDRVRMDIEYINNWSVMLDLSILIRTVFAVLGPRAY